jgi:hypothetical protein
MAKKKAGSVTPKLTDAEQEMLTHLQQGYQLETDSLGANPILRGPKDDEVLRPANANASTLKGLEKRGLIAPGKGRDLLTIMWHLKK